MKQEPHEHSFKPRTIKITLSSGTAQDILKQWICKCGKIVTYDLERKY